MPKPKIYQQKMLITSKLVRFGKIETVISADFRKTYWKATFISGLEEGLKSNIIFRFVFDKSHYKLEEDIPKVKIIVWGKK